MWYSAIGAIVMLTLSLLVSPSAIEAQQAGKVYRIGVLAGSAHDPRAKRGYEVLQQSLHELGYVEGQNVILEYRFAEENVARLPELAADLVRRHVDLIVAAGHPMVLAAKQTTTIPIVMTVPTDPVETGLVESLARPGGNITGLTNRVFEIAGKPLELFKETVPTLVRVAVFYDAANPANFLHAQAVQTAGQALGLTVQLWEVRGADDFARVFATPLVTDAQPATKVHRIGQLVAGSSSSYRHLLAAFRQGLRDLGYVEGQNLVIEERYAEGSEERLPDLAAELVQLQVDVIVAAGAPTIRAAQHATRTIPIVMAGTADAVAQGFIASLARPGGNITGVSGLGLELHGKRLELLKETVPQSARIAVLTNPASPYHASRLHDLTAAAQTLGVHLHVVELRHEDELDSAFAAMVQARAEALLVVEDALLLSRLRGRTVALAATHRLPAMYDRREIVAAGGLMSYGRNLPESHRRAATYVDQILKGATPADLPVEQPTKFELVINLKTAKALGLTIPPTLLFQADEVMK